MTQTMHYFPLLMSETSQKVKILEGVTPHVHEVVPNAHDP
jgi:hypothetical protein